MVSEVELPDNKKSKCFVFVETDYRKPGDNPYPGGPFYVTDDQTAPITAITFPQAGTRRSTVAEIAGTASDPSLPSEDPSDAEDPNNPGDRRANGSGVALVQISILNVTSGLYYNEASGTFDSPSQLWCDATGTYNWSYDCSNVNWGQSCYEVTIWSRAIDGMANVQDPPSEITFTYDDLGIDVTIISPPSCKAIIGEGGSVVIEFHASKDGNFTIQDHNGNPVCNPVHEYEIADNGASQVRVKVSDYANPPHTGSAWVEITDDQTPPVSTILNPQTGSSSFAPSEISGTAFDPRLPKFYEPGEVDGAGPDKVRVLIFDGERPIFDEEVPVDGAGLWTCDVTAVEWQNGTTYTISARATDKVGNPEVLKVPGSNEVEFTYLIPPPPEEKIKSTSFGGGGCAFTQRPTGHQNTTGFCLTLLVFIALVSILRLRYRNKVCAPVSCKTGGAREIVSMRVFPLFLVVFLVLSGCAVPAKSSGAISQSNFLLSVTETPISLSNEKTSAESKASGKVAAEISLGSYVPTAAKETYYTAGPTLGGTLQVHKGLVSNIEFALDVCYSESKREELDTLQGYLTGESALFLFQSNYIIPLGRASRQVELRLLAGGGCATEVATITTKYWDPIKGWVRDSEMSTSATLLLDATFSCLWHSDEGGGVDLRLGVLGYPLSDNVNSAITFTVGYRF